VVRCHWLENLPVDHRDDFSSGPVAVFQHLVVHANVLEDLDDSERGAREDRLDGSRGRCVGDGVGVGLGRQRLGDVRGRRRSEGDGVDEPDAVGLVR
jgi:hypothetical protein